MTYVYLFLGFFLLIFGAKYLVQASSKLASQVGLSPLVVGLTVVAYGTNSPELFVSIQAAAFGNGEIAIGNVIGSNIFNILAVLGISSLIYPLIVCKTLFFYDIPIMILTSILYVFLCLNGTITPLMGIFLLALVVLYTAMTVIRSKKSPKVLKDEYKKEFSAKKNGWQTILLELALIFLGLGMLIIGSRWFVFGASTIARYFGVSEVIIGLTLVAIGSSLPELATSIYAVVKKEYDIAVGNMVGSNIFNILGVMGIAALFSSDGIPVDPTLKQVDLPLMLIASCLCVPFSLKGPAFGQYKGVFLLLLYIAYLVYIILVPSGGKLNTHFLLFASLLFAAVSLTFLIRRAKKA